MRRAEAISYECVPLEPTIRAFRKYSNQMPLTTIICSYFWAVAKEGSLRRASEVLHVSQPSIRIYARAWELLLAMIVMEAAFGIAGLIAAPIYYAYIKNELSIARLI